MNMALNDAIDIDFLNQVIGNDTEFEKELYEIFKENFEHNFLKLKSSIVNKDNNSWYMASHALKGSCASIGAFKLSKIFDKSQKNIDSSDEIKENFLKEIQQEYLEVEKFIKNRI
jgi:HPt (histidine-containing phosphotransfer) domain-containing protein